MSVVPTEEAVTGIGAPEQAQGSDPGVKRTVVYGAAVLAGVLLVSLVVWWFQPHSFYGTVIQSPMPAEDFSLTASNGEVMSLSDFRGKFVMLDFGYTFCPDVCPMALNELAAMADALGPGKMDEVQVLFITLDPERDTVEQLASYLPHFDPDFLGMTGTLEEVDPVASQFGIFYEHRKEEGQTDGYFVDHSTSMILIDPDGYVRVIYNFGTPGDGIAKDINYLLRRQIF